MSVGAVMLAAGAAVRMGQVKQLLLYHGRTLIRHAVSEAAVFSPLIVVLGANAEQIQPNLNEAACQVVLNDDWQTGMGSTLKLGITRLMEVSPDTSGVAVLLADQPRISSKQFDEMLQIFYEGKWSIVSAEYKGAPGVPAIFGKQLFPMLLSLPPEAGARHLLRNAGSSLFRYPLPEAAIDVDTPEDYADLT